MPLSLAEPRYRWLLNIVTKPLTPDLLSHWGEGCPKAGGSSQSKKSTGSVPIICNPQ